MRMILWHLEYLCFQDKRISNRPYGISKFLKAKQEGSFKNILAIFTCIEKSDSEKEVVKAKIEICKFAENIKVNNKIVLVPFVHLSNNIAPPPQAISLLSSLRSQLELAGMDVSAVSFGYHKTLELHFKGYGHPLAVAYRNF